MTDAKDADIIEFIRDFFQKYSNRDTAIKNHFSDEFYGMDGINSTVYNHDQWLEALDVDFNQITEPFDITLLQTNIQPITKDKVGVYVIGSWDLPKRVRILEAFAIRTFFILEKLGESFMIFHQSNSICFSYPKNTKEVFPERYAKLQQERFEKLVEEKTLEMKNLNQQLKTQSNELEIINKELAQYAIITAHDIKSPLVSISTVYDLLMDKYADMIHAKDKEMLQTVNIRLANLTELMSNVLQLYSLDQNALHSTIECSKLNFERLFDEITKEIKRNEKKPFSIQCDTIPHVVANKTLIKQLFVNLILNSIKYARPDVPLKMQIESRKACNNFIEFKFRDNGIGIADDQRKKVFNLFSRAGQESVTGLGLGLTICKRIVNYYGGDIWIEDNNNEAPGIAVCFTIKNSF